MRIPARLPDDMVDYLDYLDELVALPVWSRVVLQR